MKAQQASLEFGLWHYVWKLVRLRAVITISGFRRARLIRKILMIILALVVVSIVVFVFVLSWLLLKYLRSPSLVQLLAQQNMGEVTPFIESIPALILAGAFMGILLTSFGVLLQGLYLAGDMDFLLSAPVPIRAVFVTKLLQAILPNFGLMALFGLPVLFGLGAAGGYNFLYYPLVVVVLALLTLAAAGLSSLLVMGIVRIFPARRVAEVLGFLGAIISIVCSQLGNLFNTTNLANQNLGGRQLPLTWVTAFNTPWSPLSWAGRGLVDFGEGRWLTGLGFLALTLGLASVLFIVSLNTAERLYYTGWASIQTSVRKKRPAKAGSAAPGKEGVSVSRIPGIAAKPFSLLVERLAPPAIRAVFKKDLLVLRRDLRNLSQVVTPIILGIMYAFMIVSTGGNPPAGRGEAPDWFMQGLKNLMVYANVAISLFVGWSLLSRLALMSFSQEGKNYWMLKSAPVKTGHLLVAKFLVAYVPSLILGWAFMLIISLVQRSSLSIFIFGLVVVALSIAGTAGINLAFGVIGANLKWEDPRRMSAGSAGCVSFLVSTGIMVIGLGFFFLPSVFLPGSGVPVIVSQGIGLVLGGAVSLACAIIPPRMVVSRVARIGEE